MVPSTIVPVYGIPSNRSLGSIHVTPLFRNGEKIDIEYDLAMPYQSKMEAYSISNAAPAGVKMTVALANPNINDLYYITGYNIPD